MEISTSTPPALTRFDALFLDVGGTLIYPRHGVANSYSRYAAAMGVTLQVEGLEEAFLKSYVAAKKDALTQTGMTFGATEEDGRRFWRNVFNPLLPAGLSPALGNALFESVYAGFEDPDEWALFEDARNLIERAEQMGLPMVIVSNWDTRLPALLEALGLAQKMTGIVCSAVLGIEKPNPAIFNHAKSHLDEQTRGGRILMVGDSHREDILGAQACGIETLHVHRGAGAAPFPNMVRRIDSILS